MKTQQQILVPIFVLLVLTTSACKSSAAPAQAAEPAATLAQVAAAQPTQQPTSQQQSTQEPAPQQQPTQEPAPQQQPTQQQTSPSATSLSAELQPVSGTYLFAEGPAVDANGNVYFSDINAGKIYKWSPGNAGSVSVFVEGLSSPNGLMFDKSGSLITCEGGKGRLISINPHGQITVLVDKYNGIRFNEPNDLWIDAQGGIYFTDPAFQLPIVQDGQHVYYLSPDRSQVTRVISDLQQPNGLVGTADGKTLYVADYGANQTYAYTINSYGTLGNKTLFAAVGSDGMDLDAAGDLYLTTPNKVQVFDAAGKHLRDIPTIENPTNLVFAGEDGLTLFITARTAVYTVKMTVSRTTIETSTSKFTLTSPDLPADGRLPIEYTCDGAASTLAISWSAAPAGTKSFAVIMHHLAPDNAIHWYWVVYNIPADTSSLAKNVSGIGTIGTNSVNKELAYAPPCSKGPGDKEYIYTVYALSEPLVSVPPTLATREAMLTAIKDITIASAELHVVNARP
jgi:gluconolactonase